jgi:hypothetical protein
VARDRIELSTFRFSGGRSYRLSYLAVTGTAVLVVPYKTLLICRDYGRSEVSCGPDGIRTRDLRLDRAA